MSGRYGSDQFSRFIMGCAIVTLVLYFVLGSSIMYFLTIALLIYNYYRTFSRNYNKRYQENIRFLEIKDRLFGGFSDWKETRNTPYRIYRCPGCRKKVRVPKGKGKISITCPRCHREFIKRT